MAEADSWRDRDYMARAIELAERGRYTTMPNPRVGCVIVREGRVIGQGWHQRAGEAHAEINALREAGDVAGATVYLTLEPCSHFGRTPPCVEALIKARPARVVVAAEDPNPQVAGRGLQRLREAGIAAECGLLDQQARALNPGFYRRMEHGLPWVRSKLAMSLDGRTAMASGESQWITGPAARADVQRLRAGSCAILTGVATVLADDPALTVRATELNLPDAEAIAQRQPLRVVLDSAARTPPDARLLRAPGRTVIVHADAEPARLEPLAEAGAELLAFVGTDGRVDLRGVLHWLGQQQINEVQVEAGPVVNGALWRARLVDELVVYMAPTLLGSAARPLLDLPLAAMAEQQRLTISGITAVGDDWRIDARPALGA